MWNLVPWLLSIAWPIAARVLTQLGIGYVVYRGLDTAVTAALDAAKASMNSMPADVALLVARFGFFDYMSIVCGALVASLAWKQTKKLVSKPPGG